MSSVAKLPEGGEAWSWRKFFSGIFNGINSAKAIITTFHQILIAAIVAGLIFGGITLWKHFHKKKGQPVPISVTTNNGAIHSSTDEIRKKYGLINVF